jgi:pimeloyl-ACP methyl ester carboxylesterase
MLIKNNTTIISWRMKKLNLFYAVCLNGLLSVAALFLTSCFWDNQDDILSGRILDGGEVLVEYQRVGGYSLKELKQRFNDQPQLSMILNQDIQVYQLVYLTHDVEGNAIKASGLVIYPSQSKAKGIVSYQHGTIRSNQSAPSAYFKSSEMYGFGSALGSAGYVISAPDYLGYGVSHQYPHPYEHAASMASASLDMLRATQEFCKAKELNPSERLFLAGYSQGGNATMALHRLIEQQYAKEFSIDFSIPGAGAYDKTAFAGYIINNDQPLNFINTYLWVLDTYNWVYGLGYPWSFFLTEKYANLVEKNGVFTEVNPHPEELFHPDFREGLATGALLDILTTFKENNTFDWKPKATVILVHGTDDDYVPFFNSQNAYDAMLENGAASVQLVPLPDKNHYTAIPDYFKIVFSELEKATR